MGVQSRKLRAESVHVNATKSDWHIGIFQRGSHLAASSKQSSKTYWRETLSELIISLKVVAANES